jgi:hypothetical protein
MEVRTLHSIQQIYDPPSPGERKFEKLNMQQLNLSLLDLSIELTASIIVLQSILLCTLFILRIKLRYSSLGQVH